MCAQQDQNRDLVDTTDCLEAIGVFKFWKNLFFLVILVCMLLLAACFLVEHFALVTDAQPADAAAEIQQAEQAITEPPVEIAEVTIHADDEEAKIASAAKEIAGDANTPPAAEAPAASTPKLDLSEIVKPVHIMWTVRAVDFVLIATAMMYCLTLLFTLKVSMVGRLGGINHIARAVMLSMIFLVLLMPWQEVFGWFIKGIIFTPAELKESVTAFDTASAMQKIMYFARFVAYWALGLLLLLCAQTRTGRWSKATLKRLEVF